MFEKVAKAERRIPKAQELVDEHVAKVQAAEADVEKYEAEHEQFGTATDLETKQKELNMEIRAKKEKLKALNVDKRKMNEATRRHADAIKDFDANIAKEEAKIAAAAGGRREAVLGKLEQAKTAVAECEAQLDAIGAQKADAKENVTRLSAAGTQVGHEVEQAQQAVGQNEYSMGRARESMNNRFAAYGQGMPRALDEIQRVRWQGEVPLGPFGMHVRVRDPRWAPLLRQILGHQMFGFKVTDARDRAQLKSILERNHL
jgi:chromosome segregation ATPase